ncbi:TolB family protein [Streptomyces endophytica]|uniref:Uncharacterized protein n=1 Tax=Streptomyces endophytica TaxID=2991496 RepID=A0ABY6PGV2_9ACTN|nr:hypothetical protein [Streptomyces endophytica]UZJ32718.1 hypothetical protein OJ254_23615 [Streptomyces endophytica]
MALAADADGRCEIFTWDARTGTTRRVTDSRDGTLHCAVDADARVWWFAEDRSGRGRWYFQDFGGGPAVPGLAGLRPGLPYGLAVSDTGTAAIGLGDGRRTTVHLGTTGGPGRPVLTVDGAALLTGISPTGRLLAVSGPAGSDRAVTLVGCSDGEAAEVARLSGRRGRLWALGFAPGAAVDGELLLVQEADERYLLASWTPGGGLRSHDWCRFDTEITARWYPAGRRVLVRQDRHGRSTLATADLDRCTLTTVRTPPGTLLDAAPHPGDDVHYLWTDTTTPRSCAPRPAPGCPRSAACPRPFPAGTATCGRPARTDRCTPC